MAVGLSEINAFTPQADLAKGDMYAPINLDNALRYGAQAAQSYSDNILKRYAMHQQAIANFTQNHQLDYAGVMREDIPVLKAKAIAYMNKIAQDPNRINQIGSDPEWEDIQASIAQSKGDNSLLTLQNGFRRDNPDLYNKINDQKEAQFRTKALGTRAAQDIQWDLPSSIDIEKLASGTLKNVGQKRDLPIKSDFPGYFAEQNITEYPLDKFTEIWDNVYGSGLKVDAYGHTVEQATKDIFDRQPESIKRQYEGADGLKKYWRDLGMAYYREKDINDTKLIEDKYSLEKEKIKQKWAEIGIQKDKVDKENAGDVLGADSVLNEATSIINKGTPVIVQGFGGKKDSKEVIEIADPTLLKTFGSIDQVGNVKNVPDAIQYDKNTGELELVYYKHKKETVFQDGQMKTIDTGEISKTASGKRETLDRKPLNERTWLKTITQRSFPNKDIGGVNAIIDNVLNKAGNSLYNVAQIYKGEAPETKAVDLPATNGKIDPSKLKKGQSYKYNSKTYQWDGSKLIPQ